MLTFIGAMLAAVLAAGPSGPHPVYVIDLRDDGTGTVFVDRSPARDDHSLSMAVRLESGVVRGVTSSRQRVVYCPPCDAPRLRVDPPDSPSFLYPVGAMWAGLTGRTVWIYDLRFDGPTGTAAGDIVVDTTPHRNDRSLSLHVHLNDHVKVTRIWTSRTWVAPRNVHHRPLRVDPPTP